VDPVRVVIALPPLLRELVASLIAERADMTVVAEVDDHHAVAEVAGRLGAQVAIVGPDLDAASCRTVLESQPRLELLTIYDDGRDAFLCDLVTRVRATGAMASDSLAEAIALGARSCRNAQALSLLPPGRS
jgi:hypothetical protein